MLPAPNDFCMRSKHSSLSDMRFTPHTKEDVTNENVTSETLQVQTTSDKHLDRSQECFPF